MAEDSWPHRLRRWGLRAWFAVGIGVAAYFSFVALTHVRIVVLPILIALFPGAILLGPARYLQRRGVPRALSALVVLLVSIGLIVGVGFLLGGPLASGLSDLTSELEEGYQALRQWLIEGPAGMTDEQIDGHLESVLQFIGDNGGSMLLGGAATVVELVIGLVTMLIVVFFILKDADRMAGLALDRIREERAAQIRTSLGVGRRTLAHYLGGLALVGVFDAVLIGLGLFVIGVPLAFPIAVIAFFASFFPLVGAWVAGLIGVAVAFIHGGLGDALLALAIITAVEQLEANVVAPVVFRQTLQLHPLLTIIGLLAGGALFGILGAFLAVPMLAVTFAILQALAKDPDRSLVALARAR
ncbi:AI-2E family transporter [soil metagenome]